MIKVHDIHSEQALSDLLCSLALQGRNTVLVCGEDAAQRLKMLASRRTPDLKVRQASCDIAYVAAHPDCATVHREAANKFDIVIVTAEANSDLTLLQIGMSFDPATEVIILGQRAKWPIAVSLAKSGTHMLARALQHLGYTVIGPGGALPGKIWQLFAVVRIAERLGQKVPYFIGTDWQYYARAFSWLALISRLTNLVLVRKDRTGFASDFGWLPKNAAVMLHDMPIDRVDREFFVDWYLNNEPKIIFNYRDPRAMFCSYTRFLLRGKTAIGAFADQLAHSEILKGMSSNKERLMHAITDRTFPFRNSLSESTWMLRHPRILKVRYEDLVGDRGGGTAQDQHRSVFMLMLHLRCAGAVKDIADNLYDTESNTFDRGAAYGWRAEFDQEHHDEFEKHFGDVLQAYGYMKEHRCSGR